MSLFFGNLDVKVAVEKAATLTLGKLDKLLIATNEEEIPAMAISGSDGVAELEKYLEEKALTAPKLVQGVKIALGQEDNSGNKLIPNYLFVIGKKTTEDNTAVFTAIEEFDKLDEADFYGIATVFEDAKFEEWAQLYSKPHLYGTYTTSNRTLEDKSKSPRIFGQNYSLKGEESNQDEYNHIAWLARILFAPKLIGPKFKRLNGITTDPLTDGDVDRLTKAGWNGYRRVRGKGQTTGSICTDGVTHIDQTLLRDTVIYNVANSLMDMFDTQEIVPMEYAGKKLVETYINKALMYCGDNLGLIAQGEDGRYLFKVTVPTFTAIMKSLREMSGVKFEFEPRIPGEKIMVTGKELLEWGGNE